MGDDEFKRILNNTPASSDYGSKSSRIDSPPRYSDIYGDPSNRQPHANDIYGDPSNRQPHANDIYGDPSNKQQYGLYAGNINAQPETFTQSANGQCITCRVCQSEVDIVGKRDQFVVKCLKCNEATPIQNPPTGKKYVRCPCNCLLVCKISSQRIACPRPNCKRIINLGTTPVTPPTRSLPGTNSNAQRVSCIHCGDMFLFNSSDQALVKCPHCRKVSSVGVYATYKGSFYLILGVILLALTVVLVIWTKPSLNKYPGYYAIYAACAVLILWVFWKMRYYLCMKVSSVDVA